MSEIAAYERQQKRQILIGEERRGEVEPSPPYDSGSRTLNVSHLIFLCSASFFLNTLLRAYPTRSNSF